MIPKSPSGAEHFPKKVYWLQDSFVDGQGIREVQVSRLDHDKTVVLSLVILVALPAFVIIVCQNPEIIPELQIISESYSFITRENERRIGRIQLSYLHHEFSFLNPYLHCS